MQNSSLTIRPATLGDVGAIEKMLHALAEFLGEPGACQSNSATLARYGFGEQKVYHALLAWHGKEPVGLAVYFSEYSTWRGMPGVYILDLFVADTCRGSGLGRQLIAEVLQRAEASWNAGYLRLTVHRHNQAANDFYQRLGFTLQGEDMVMLLTEQALQNVKTVGSEVAGP